MRRPASPVQRSWKNVNLRYHAHFLYFTLISIWYIRFYNTRNQVSRVQYIRPKNKNLLVLTGLQFLWSPLCAKWPQRQYNIVHSNSQSFVFLPDDSSNCFLPELLSINCEFTSRFTILSKCRLQVNSMSHSPHLTEFPVMSLNFISFLLKNWC